MSEPQQCHLCGYFIENGSCAVCAELMEEADTLDLPAVTTGEPTGADIYEVFKDATTQKSGDESNG